MRYQRISIGDGWLNHAKHPNLHKALCGSSARVTRVRAGYGPHPIECQRCRKIIEKEFAEELERELRGEP